MTASERIREARLEAQSAKGADMRGYSTISRSEFNAKRRHDYAGWRDEASYALHGLPLLDAWWLEYDERHGTMLVFGRVSWDS